MSANDPVWLVVGDRVRFAGHIEYSNGHDSGVVVEPDESLLAVTGDCRGAGCVVVLWSPKAAYRRWEFADELTVVEG